MAINISAIELNSSLQKVWHALTDPEMVKQWQFGSELVTDCRVGSSIRFTTAWEGKVFEQWGNIVEVVPEQLISYTLFAPRPGLEDKPENYFLMTYKINQKSPELVLLQIIQEDNRPGAKQEYPQGEENPILTSLKKLVEA
jgi:uncharacterized protein YndB with AHSA1/START domain